MSSSEDDYMSNTFLIGCVKDDVRPGLIQGQSKKRDHEMFKKKIETAEVNKMKNRPKCVVESENRETALSEPISTDNKGFAMLTKLGFKPGSGLGKSCTGRTEPVPIKLKTDRQGLGRAEAVRERRVKNAAARKAFRDELTDVDNYRSKLAEKTAEKKTVIDLRKSQRICLRLDQDEGITEPEETWYWPEGTCKEDDNGCYEDNVDDMTEHEPVSSVHKEESEDSETTEFEEQDTEANAVDDYSVVEKLESLTNYLRNTYFYCIWCAIQFDDKDDLRRECPGPTFQDH